MFGLENYTQNQLIDGSQSFNPDSTINQADSSVFGETIDPSQDTSATEPDSTTSAETVDPSQDTSATDPASETGITDPFDPSSVQSAQGTSPTLQ